MKTRDFLQYNRDGARLSTPAFTLVETLITIIIFTFIAGGLYGAMFAGQNSWTVSRNRIIVQQDVRQVMERMKADLIQAGPSSIVNVPANGTWQSFIRFNIPQTVVNGSLVWDTNQIIYIVIWETSNLDRSYGGVDKIISQNIQSIQFRRQAVTPNILEVIITGESPDARDTWTYPLSFQVRLRN